MRVRNLWNIMPGVAPQVWTNLSIRHDFDLLDIETGVATAETPCLRGFVLTASIGKALCEMFGGRAVFSDDGGSQKIVKIGCLDVEVLRRLKNAVVACDDVVTIRAILWAIDPVVFSEHEPRAIRNVREGIAVAQAPLPDNVVRMPAADLDRQIAAMTGPERGGNHVVIDDRLVPNLAMRDAGERIEFVLDSRMIFSFPRDVAWLAASFAFHAMAIGAGFGGPGGLHESARNYGVSVTRVDTEEGK